MKADAAAYRLLPFQFRHWRNGRFIIVNDAGDYQFLTRDEFSALLGQGVDSESSLFRDLKSKHFVAQKSDLHLAIDLLANKYRTRKGFLRDFTSLHMLVVDLSTLFRTRVYAATFISSKASGASYPLAECARWRL